MGAHRKTWGFPGGAEVKSLPANTGDTRVVSSIPGSGRCPGEANGYLLQYSCLENSIDGGDWWATVPRVTKSQTWLSMHAHNIQENVAKELSTVDKPPSSSGKRDQAWSSILPPQEDFSLETSSKVMRSWCTQLRAWPSWEGQMACSHLAICAGFPSSFQELRLIQSHISIALGPSHHGLCMSHSPWSLNKVITHHTQRQCDRQCVSIRCFPPKILLCCCWVKDHTFSTSQLSLKKSSGRLTGEMSVTTASRSTLRGTVMAGLLQSWFGAYVVHWCLPWWLDGKESACNAGDPGSIPELERCPGVWNGNPLQYSCLENSIDRGAWWATVHGIAKSRTRLSY